MGKKKRYLQEKDVYVKEPTLQEAWEVVSRHICEKAKELDLSAFFIDILGSKNCKYGQPLITYYKGSIEYDFVKSKETYDI